MPRDTLSPKGKRGRPRKNPPPIETKKPSVEVTLTDVNEVNSNVVGDIENPIKTVTVNESPTDKSVESSQPSQKKKSPTIDPNQICMACGNIISDTPNKLELSMWLDAPSYKFNTKLNDKGKIILCHKCEKHLIEAIDKELKKMGCKQKFELTEEKEMEPYPKPNPNAFQTFIDKNRENSKE